MYAYDFPTEWKDRLFSTFFLKQAHALFNLYQKPEKTLSECPSEHETNFEVGL